MNILRQQSTVDSQNSTSTTIAYKTYHLFRPSTLQIKNITFDLKRKYLRELNANLHQTQLEELIKRKSSSKKEAPTIKSDWIQRID